jgi:DNA-binding SARP family transcriptional activator/CRP-like cAMP-binding protein
MIELLRTVPLFASLQPRAINFLKEIVREVEYPENTVLFHEGDPGDRLYVIIEGQLEAVKAPGRAEEHVLRVCEAGEYIGEMCFFNPSRVRSAAVRTRTRVRMLELTRDDFEALFRRRPSVAYAIAQGLTQRMLDSEERFLRILAEKDRQLHPEIKQGHITETGAQDADTVGPDGQTGGRRKIPGSDIPRIQIKTFGNFQVFRGEALIGEREWKGRQPKALLKAIITRGMEGVPKDVLIEDLWPEESAATAETCFRVILHRLRKVLQPSMDRASGSSYVVLKENLVSLRRDLCRMDLDEFLVLRKRGKKAEDAGDIGEALLCYRTCVDLYGGDFLSEDLYVAWAEPKRNELLTMYIDLLYRMAELYETQGSSKRAVECYKSIIKADPVREEAYQKLMQIYSNRGMRAEALKVYEECKRVLEDQVAAEPGKLTVSIYRRIMEKP